MARTTRGTNSRRSRNWGRVSGVTYETQPSGVTIDKSYITTGSGVSIHNTSLIHTSQGYPYYHPTVNNINLISGVSTIGGTSGYFRASTLGLNTLTALIVSAGDGPNMAHAKSATSKTVTTVIYDTAAYSGATVYTFDAPSGATRTSSVSLHYAAFGT